MSREDIKRILMSLSTAENDTKVNFLLGKIDMIPDDKLETMIDEIGATEEDIRAFFEGKVRIDTEEHIPINSMFSYGVNGSTVHLHLPVELKETIDSLGIRKTIDLVNLHMLDAIDRLMALKRDGYYRLKGTDEFYMISPALISSELKALSDMDFETNTMRRKELSDPEILAKSHEHQLAFTVFGSNHNVGSAKIKMDVVDSKEWQDKKRAMMKKYEEEGLVLSDSSIQK